MKKLQLKKEAIISLSTEEQLNAKGGWTTSFGNCTQGLQELCCAGSNLNCSISNCANCNDHIEHDPMKP